MFSSQPNPIINSRAWMIAAIQYTSRKMNRTGIVKRRKAHKAERQNRKRGRINARNA